MGTTTHAPTDRITCPPDHKHGSTHTCYVGHRCRCEDCKHYHIEYQRTHRRDLAQQSWGTQTPNFIDAEPVRRHIAKLRAFGIGIARIADLAKVNRDAIDRAVYGANGHPPTARIRHDIAAAVLAIQPVDENRHPIAPGMDATGAHRRIQALVACGWSTPRLSAYLGLGHFSVPKYLMAPMIRRATHDRVAAMFDDLWDKRPPTETPAERVSYKRALAYAKRKGWVPPLAWDDIDTDPEPPQPRRNVGRVRDREESVARLHSLRWSDSRIAAELEIAPDTVWRIRHRLKLPGWSKEQQEAAA